MTHPHTRTELMAAIEAEATPIAKRENITQEQAVALFVCETEEGQRLYARYRGAPATQTSRAGRASRSDWAFASLSQRAAEWVGEPAPLSSDDRPRVVSAFVETDEGRRLRKAYDDIRELEYASEMERGVNRHA